MSDKDLPLTEEGQIREVFCHWGFWAFIAVLLSFSSLVLFRTLQWYLSLWLAKCDQAHRVLWSMLCAGFARVKYLVRRNCEWKVDFTIMISNLQDLKQSLPLKIEALRIKVFNRETEHSVQNMYSSEQLTWQTWLETFRSTEYPAYCSRICC